ncbi:MAG TPA: lysophospholipid acyltransferase family protein [Candidatus Hydrogenedentes bacterium]|nr:lysophospholipid acyltransferase family protein [Candidatus Hydrogenedentota bacterium]
MTPGATRPDPDVFRRRVSCVRGWLVFLGLCLRLITCRMARSIPLPDFVPHKDPLARTAYCLFRWHRLRIIGHGHCPTDGPAVFVANHHGLDDPAFLWPAIHLASGERYIPRFLMRDDFFKGFPWDWLPLSLNTLCERCGAVLISRGRVNPHQLRPALNALRTGEACALFPSGTRSRTGAWIEYRPGDIEVPGDPAALAALGARMAELPAMPVVPAGITCHPVSGEITVAFGPPIFVAARSEPANLVACNAEICAATGNLVEVNAAHLVATLLWAMNTHGRERLGTRRLVQAVLDWISSTDHALIHPALRHEPGTACLQACHFFARQGCARLAGNELIVCPKRVNTCPPWTVTYRKKNPVRYWTNQVLHLRNLDSWAVSWVLGT